VHKIVSLVFVSGRPKLKLGPVFNIGCSKSSSQYTIGLITQFLTTTKMFENNQIIKFDEKVLCYAFYRSLSDSKPTYVFVYTPAVKGSSNYNAISSRRETKDKSGRKEHISVFPVNSETLYSPRALEMIGR
jgi:hypothetical protein